LQNLETAPLQIYFEHIPLLMQKLDLQTQRDTWFKR
jgi:hypothetical protein